MGLVHMTSSGKVKSYHSLSPSNANQHFQNATQGCEIPTPKIQDATWRDITQQLKEKLATKCNMTNVCLKRAHNVSGKLHDKAHGYCIAHVWMGSPTVRRAYRLLTVWKSSDWLWLKRLIPVKKKQKKTVACDCCFFFKKWPIHTSRRVLFSSPMPNDTKALLAVH